MKVQCLQENLARGLSIVRRAVTRRSTLPVLTNVLLDADGDRLELAGNDLELAITCGIVAKVEDPGRYTVPMTTLADLVNGFPAERVDLELNSRGTSLNVKCDRYEANVHGISADEFPAVQGFPETGAELDGAVFWQMIGQAAYAAASDESRPVLTGALVRFEADGDLHTALTMAAADGFRLVVRKQGVARMESLEGLEAIVPARALRELARIVRARGGELVTVAFGEGDQPARVFFRCGDVVLVSQCVQGRFPDYAQIVPTGWTTQVDVDVQELRAALKLARVFAREASGIVKLSINPEGLVRVSATSVQTGDQAGEVEADVLGEALEIAFNGGYLDDALGSLGTERARIEGKGQSSPGVLRPVAGPDLTAVVMPIHVS